MSTRTYIEDGRVRAMLHAYAARGKHLPLRRIGVVMLASVNKNFRDGGRPRRWEPLRPNTIAARERGGDRPLRDTGVLEKSVQTQLQAPDNVKVYTDHEAAAFHQYGTRPYLITPRTPGGRLFFTVAGAGGGRDAKGRFKKSKKTAVAREVRHPGLPARPFMVWQDEDVDRVAELLADHLEGGS